MGSCYSRVEKQDTVVSRYKARRRYAKHLVKARHALSAAHAFHLRSLRATGAALLHLANSETLHQTHHPHSHHLPLQPLSPSSDAHTSITASPFLPPPPPPPPSSWDFWDPFAPSSSTSVTDEEWETNTEPAVTAPPPPPPSSRPPSVISKESNSASDLAIVVSRTSKDFVEIVKELDEYFVKAADAGWRVSEILEVPVSGFSNRSGRGKSFHPLGWSWGANSGGFGRLSEEMGGGGGGRISHCCTLEKVYAWEKKLYLEVKNAESIKMDLEKRVVLQRKQEAKGVDYVKIEKNRKEIARLESRLMVASQATETTSTEIKRLREAELFPQLLDLLNGLMCMWRRMYECHQVQTHIVEQLKFLNSINLGTKPTSGILKQSTLQFEHEVDQWYSSFCTLIKAQRDYINSLTGWLRLSLFLRSNNDPLANTKLNTPIYSLCEEWQLALDRIPDKVASEGIKSLLTVIHAVVIQQVEEHKQKKRSDAAFKKLEKRVADLRSLELKHWPDEISVPESYCSRLMKKRAEVESLRSKAEDEKTKYDKCAGVTRAMTLNSLQTGLPNVFQAITGFSSVCMQALESVYNQPKNSNMDHDLSKRLLTD